MSQCATYGVQGRDLRAIDVEARYSTCIFVTFVPMVIPCLMSRSRMQWSFPLLWKIGSIKTNRTFLSIDVMQLYRRERCLKWRVDKELDFESLVHECPNVHMSASMRGTIRNARQVCFGLYY